jgi:hypothetical protein
MLFSPSLIPLLHGQVGILDELLFFGTPLVVAIIILAVASKRAKARAQPRERQRSTGPAPENTEDAKGS